MKRLNILLILLILLPTTACATPTGVQPKPQIAYPKTLTEPCYIPQVEITSGGDIIAALLKMREALIVCKSKHESVVSLLEESNNE